MRILNFPLNFLLQWTEEEGGRNEAFTDLIPGRPTDSSPQMKYSGFAKDVIKDRLSQDWQLFIKICFSFIRHRQRKWVSFSLCRSYRGSCFVLLRLQLHVFIRLFLIRNIIITGLFVSNFVLSAAVAKDFPRGINKVLIYPSAYLPT